MQTKRETLIEIGINTGVGLIGSMIITYAILRFKLSPGISSLLVTTACTIWSILRQYVIRRYFNKLAKPQEKTNV